MIAANFSSFMEVGVGLSLSFAILERVRAYIRTSRSKNIKRKLDNYEGSTEHQEVVGLKLHTFADQIFKMICAIELIGVYLCSIAVGALVFQLMLFGFDPKIMYSDAELYWYIALPSLMMPMLLCIIYTIAGIGSVRIHFKLKEYSDAARLTKELDRDAQILKIEKAKKK